MRPRSPYLQTLAILALLTVWAVPAMAGDPIVIKTDLLRPDRYQITDTTGHAIGTVKRDPLDNRKALILDRDGEPIGYVQPSTLPTSTNRYDVFTPQGERTGTIQRDILRGDRYHLNGKTIKRDTLRPDRWVVE